jgi:hypothetical protein
VAERREDLRAADADRESTAELLKGALNEGRLTLTEYDERLRDAYGARTYGELDKVLADLPAQRSQVAPMPTGPLRQVRADSATGPTGVPPWLVKIWGAWAVAVFVNVVIWALVSVSSDDGPVYFWPMWVAGPWGAVLLVTTVRGLVFGVPEPRARPGRERRAVRRDDR